MAQQYRQQPEPLYPPVPQNAYPPPAAAGALPPMRSDVGIVYGDTKEQPLLQEQSERLIHHPHQPAGPLMPPPPVAPFDQRYVAQRRYCRCCGGGCGLCGCVSAVLIIILIVLAAIGGGVYWWISSRCAGDKVTWVNESQVYTSSQISGLSLLANPGTIEVTISPNSSVIVSVRRCAYDAGTVQAYPVSYALGNGGVLSVTTSEQSWWTQFYACTYHKISVAVPASIDYTTFTLRGKARWGGTIGVDTTTLIEPKVTCDAAIVENPTGLNIVRGITSRAQVSVAAVNGGVTARDTTAQTSLEITATNGDVRVGAISATNSVKVGSTNGRLDVAYITSTSSSVDISTTNGAVNATDVSAGTTLSLSTTGGIVDVANLRSVGLTSVSSTNGMVSLANQLAGNAKISTTNGDVNVAIDSTKYTCQYTASTTNGRVSATGSALTKTQSDGTRGYIGSSGATNTIDASTTNGNIYVVGH